MRQAGIKNDKRIGRAFEQLEKALAKGGLPVAGWKGHQFKYLGYLPTGPIFAIRNTVAIVRGGRVEELEHSRG